MKQYRMCVNSKCRDYRNLHNTNHLNKFCPKCGEELQHVCKICKTPICDDGMTLCAECLLKAEKDKEDRKNQIAGVAKYAITLVPVLIKKGVDQKIDVAEVVKKGASIIRK